jgi:hypothetical protein
LANLLLVSNNSDSTNPFPATSFFDIFADLSLSPGAEAFLNGPQTELTDQTTSCTNPNATALGIGDTLTNPFPNGVATGSADCGFLNLTGFAPQLAQIPEPGSLAILVGALVGLPFLRRRKGRQPAL